MIQQKLCLLPDDEVSAWGNNPQSSGAHSVTKIVKDKIRNNESRARDCT